MKKVFVGAVVLPVFAFGVWIAAAWAVALAPPQARANLFTAGGAPAGYVIISEIPGGYLSSQINVSGQILGAPGTRGLHLWNDTCGIVLSGEGGPFTGHVSAIGNGKHPTDVGDLPNVTPSATGTFSLTKVTNRFVLGNNELNVWNYTGGMVTVVVDQGVDNGGPGLGAPLLCGQLNCVPGTSCVVGGGT